MTRVVPYPGTQTVLRAVALLKSFSDARPEWGLSDLARAVGLNKTTTYRLLTALEAEGMITRSAHTEGYRLGPAAIALGGQALRSNGLRAAAHAELVVLARATQETATLEVLAEGQVLILDEVMGTHVLGNVQSLGTRWPAHATSTGKILLAHLPAAECDAILASGLAPFTSHTLTRLPALRRELARARSQGYAVAREELEDGFVAIGAAVRNYAGHVVAAVSVGGPSLRLTADRLPELGRLVMEAGERISRQLGFELSRATPRRESEGQA
jgi:DNA-binding IclR family transcriptional regulator